MTTNSENKKNINAKQRLLQAATVLFAEKGFNATSTRELCKMANVNISSIPYYYQSKEGLYKAVLKKIAMTVKESLHDFLEKVNTDKPISPQRAKELILIYIDNHIELVMGPELHGNIALLVIRENLKPSSAYEILYETIFKDLYESLCLLIGIIKNLNSTDSCVIFCANTIIGQVLSFKITTQISLRQLNLENYNNSHVEDIKKLVKEQTLRILNQSGAIE